MVAKLNTFQKCPRHRLYSNCETVQAGPYQRLIVDRVRDQIVVWHYPYEFNDPLTIIPGRFAKVWIDALRKVKE